MKVSRCVRYLNLRFHIRNELHCQAFWRLLLAKITLNLLYVSCIWYCEPVSKIVDHSWLEATPTSHCQQWDPMRIYQYPSRPAEQRIARIVNRGLAFQKKDMAAVTRICESVRKRGDQALISYSKRFDSTRMSVKSMRVSKKEFADAAKKVDRSFTRALNPRSKSVRPARGGWSADVDFGVVSRKPG